MYKQFKKLWKVAAATLAIVLALAACGGGSSSGEQVLRLASANALNSLNHVSTSEAVNFQAIGNFLEGLTTYDKDGKVVGSMAKDWKTSEDGLVWTFNLRDGIKWSNGTPVTAADFVFGWQKLATGKDSPYASALQDGKVKNAKAVTDKELPESELGIKAIDDKTLEVTLDGAVPFFDKLMAFGPLFPVNEAFWNEVGGEEVFGTSAETVLANGPFMLEAYAPDTEYILVKNPDYWDAKNVKLEKIETRIVKEPTTQVTMYNEGSIDRLQLASADLFDQFKDDKNVTYFEEGALFYFYLSGSNGPKSPLLGNKNFRAAVAHAVDKSLITDQILKNGSMPADYLVPKNFDALNGKDFRDYANQYNEPMFNVAKAVEFLEAAKAELPGQALEFDLTISETATSKKIYENVEAQIEQNLPGVKVNIKTIPGSTFYPTLREMNTNAATGGWGADYVDVATYFGIFKSTDGHNYAQWNNPEYDRLIEEAAAEANPQKRWDLYVEAEKVLLDDYTIIPVYQRGSATVLNPKVKGYALSPVAPDVFFKYISIA